jgi:hypothetical protein
MLQYEKLVRDISQIVSDHFFLKDFGYGNLSDIKVRSEQTTDRSADYPYLFLNPTTHSRTPNALTYNFNTIIMDIVNTEDDYLKIHSECSEYMDDILARLKLEYRYAIGENINYTVFKERFIDEVAGVTVNLSITLPKPLDSCVAPFIPPFVWNRNFNRYNYEDRDWNHTPPEI